MVEIDTKNILVEDSSTLKPAMRKINKNGLGVVFVESEGKIIGSLTDGDIRRTLLEGYDLNTLVTDSMNSNPIIFDSDKIDEQRLNSKVEFGSRDVSSD